MLSGRIDPPVIGSLVVPKINPGQGVIINGRAPIWLYAYLIRHCEDAPWIAIFNPMDGAVVVASRSGSEGAQNVGDVIPIGEVLPYLSTSKSAGKVEGEKPREVVKSKAIAFVGPPHSGKSVLMNALRLRMQEMLTPEKLHRNFYVLRACPDGEGDWFSAIPPEIALTLRYKTSFDAAFLDKICTALESLRFQKRLVFVDCGGEIDKKNQRILNLCTHAIIVSRDRDQIPLWHGAALASELEILAEVQSMRVKKSKILSSCPLRIQLGKLERGSESGLSLPQALVELIENLIKG